MKLKRWYQSGAPWIWLNAGAVTISLVMVVALLLLIAARGLGHFWPKTLYQYQYEQEGQVVRLIGEQHDVESIPARQLSATAADPEALLERQLIKIGNREVNGLDFRWIMSDQIREVTTPAELVLFERYEWGNLYGYLNGIREAGQAISPTEPDGLWQQLQARIERVSQIHDQITEIEKEEIGAINFGLEELRLRGRQLELANTLKGDPAYAQIAEEKVAFEQQYGALQQRLADLRQQSERDSLSVILMDGQEFKLSLAKVVAATRPNEMGMMEKLVAYVVNLGHFLGGDPREANTEGGIFPAIFGTVMLVLLMSVVVTPFGVMAAIYLREYATQGPLTRTIRIAVNNLAGVPAIVYGVFGLGFFVYFLGGSIDALFYPEALPAPTFGTPGILWSALTLALLTVPVVIVSTEEGLARIPSQIREGIWH